MSYFALFAIFYIICHILHYLPYFTLFAVLFFRNMPDIDTLMQEWPPEFEDLLKEVCIIYAVAEFIFYSTESYAAAIFIENNKINT